MFALVRTLAFSESRIGFEAAVKFGAAIVLIVVETVGVFEVGSLEASSAVNSLSPTRVFCFLIGGSLFDSSLKEIN